MNERLERFTDLMKQVFELDKSDLDFGIYRIMNIRKAEIERFLVNGLPEKVRETLAPFADGDKAEIQAQIAEIEKNARDFGMDASSLPESNPMGKKYRELQKKLAEGTDLDALETDVYSALYSFFNRYYEEGDFISKRRYKEGVYAIPYEGEEVKLYWANQDQYYVKTSENFKDYSFVVNEDYTVHFRLVDATTEQNNNKESADSKRVFMLFEEDEENYPGIKTFEWNEESRELIIRFVFDIPEDKKKKYAEENYKAIVAWIIEQRKAEFNELTLAIPTGKAKETTTLLEKHLKGYVAKNTFDYFIHKDLRGFLTRELDFYIKSEIMHLEDLDTDNEARVETYLAKIKAIKRVGKVIIDFLAQIEDFQKKLWLKKKFVVETNWCITLDKIDESFWSEIIANKAQMDEWLSMYAVDEIEEDITTVGWTNPPTVEFLRQNQNLIIDTKHFSEQFKNKLVESIDNLDESVSGVMLNSDNYHGLNLLQERYRNQIDCVYGDPPYNAASSEILYKNSFKHSSWITFMHDRLVLASNLKGHKGAIITAIDENEVANLLQLLHFCFPEWVVNCISVVHNPAGVQGDNFSYSHEYAIYCFPLDKAVIGKTNREENSEEAFRDWGGTCSRKLAKNCFYPIYVKDGSIIGFGDVCEDDFHPGSQNIKRDDGVIEIYPIGDDGEERKWVFARDTVESIYDNLSVKEKKGIFSISRTKTQTSYKTVWTDKRYYANIYGSKLLNHVLGAKRFDFPKSIYTVQDCIYAVNEFRKPSGICLDYFAGSGTTGHAVIQQNREDGGNRKFVLIEMGEYFKSATLPRVKKVAFSDDWKDGIPQNRNTGVSQIIKYMRLESYEDALSNIELVSDDGQMSVLFGEDYLINYMLDLESKGSILNIDAFNNPFSYQMKITEKNECKERSVDVCETFNYLIGLTVTRQSAISYFASKASASPVYEGAVDLVKDASGDYAFRQIEGTLPDGRRALVIWRTVTDNLLASNAALDAYFLKYRINPLDREFDVIYVNGDNNLENLRTSNESWKVQMTEIEFKKRMFEEM